MRKIMILCGVALLLAAPMVMADGAAVYKAKCASCHGADGAGQTGMGKAMKLRDLGSADVQKQTDAELTSITTDGKAKMPAYKGKISDDEIKQVVAFIRTLKK
jgi:mono/diheme cytochrome c family protein